MPNRSLEPVAVSKPLSAARLHRYASLELASKGMRYERAKD
jgi:hypothetical protein